MPAPEFFIPLGIYVQRGFLDDAVLGAIQAELREAPAEPAVVGDSYSFQVDETVRRTLHAHVSPATADRVRERLLDTRPRLEKSFDVRLTGCEAPKFLVYRPGDFFREHADALAGHGLPPRQISVVIFLPGTYQGGQLTFFGLFDDPQWQRIGFGLDAEPGLMVAFRSSVRHEVTPVTRGLRTTIVSWFY